MVGIGGAPDNGNTFTNTVTVTEAGTYAMTLRYSNEEQSPSSHYNPDPVARRADISVNGGPVQKVLFPHSYNANRFWDLTVPVELKAGENTIRFSSEEQPDFNASTYISERYPTLGLRSQWAPNLDRLTFTALRPSADVPVEPRVTVSADSVGQGGMLNVSGSGFAVNEDVVVELHTDVVTLGRVTADAAGAFSLTATIPATFDVGAHRIVATGATSGRVAGTPVTVTAASGGSGGTPGDGSGAGNGSGAGDGSGAGTGAVAGSGSASGGLASAAASSTPRSGSLAATGGAFAGSVVTAQTWSTETAKVRRAARRARTRGGVSRREWRARMTRFATRGRSRRRGVDADNR